MRPVRSFLQFWYDFIIGDDATIAAGVVLALAATAVLSHHRVPTWWLLPATAVAVLALSLTRARRAIR
jgi:hypothetical protein